MPTQVELIKKYGLMIRGHLGQHLLIDPNIPVKIVQLLGICPGDRVLEIGPGLGVLTEKILAAGAELFAVEKDPKFVQALREELGGRPDYAPRFHLFHQDFLEWDWKPLLSASQKKIKVISNLPYYITAPILILLTEHRTHLSRAVCMMQKEVAKRLNAVPGTKDYGRLTLAVQYAAQTQWAFDVSPSCFTPKPAVASSVVTLDFEKKPAQLSKSKEKALFELIKTAFSERRKTLASLMSKHAGGGMSKADSEQALRKAGLEPAIRGEKLSLEDFVHLAEILKQ